MGEKYLKTSEYAKSRGRSVGVCRQVARRNHIGRLVKLENGSSERRLYAADIVEMDRRWRSK